MASLLLWPCQTLLNGACQVHLFKWDMAWKKSSFNWFYCQERLKLREISFTAYVFILFWRASIKTELFFHKKVGFNILRNLVKLILFSTEKCTLVYYVVSRLKMSNERASCLSSVMMSAKLYWEEALDSGQGHRKTIYDVFPNKRANTTPCTRTK